MFHFVEIALAILLDVKRMLDLNLVRLNIALVRLEVSTYPNHMCWLFASNCYRIDHSVGKAEHLGLAVATF
uniref:Uncharacterized protein n=1 Tax=Oltmannsiellopsis viridis TaxID=51324 RepID=Q0QIR7_OLTVI|nr:hypothetical protein OlviMp04 [Oltmannsiellopsis viridis]ABC96337.1 hypothetical protein [Oltmannsiellopsis viridis]